MTTNEREDGRRHPRRNRLRRRLSHPLRRLALGLALAVGGVFWFRWQCWGLTVTHTEVKLPGLPPIMARLTELELLPKIVPEKVRYRFVFWEDLSVPLPESAFRQGNGGAATACDGDNLWQIANEHRTAVEVLLALNPAVQWPGYLQEGQQVMLP